MDPTYAPGPAPAAAFADPSTSGAALDGGAFGGAHERVTTLSLFPDLEPPFPEAPFVLPAEEVLESMSDAFVFLDREWRYRYINGRADQVHARLGVSRDRLLGRTVWECFPALRGTEFEDEVRRSAATGRPGECEVRDPATDTWTEYRFFPAPGGIASYSRDVTLRRRVQAEQALLAAAGEALAGTLDATELLERAVRLPLPLLGRWCFVYLSEEGGALQGLATHCLIPEKRETYAEIGRRFARAAAETHPFVRAVRSGEVQVVGPVTEETFARMSADPEYVALCRRLAPSALMSVPLVARGRTLGALAFGTDEPGRRYGERDVALAKELAVRVALAFDGARLYHEARDAAARVSRLFSITTALSGAVTPAQVAHAIVVHGMRDLGARQGMLALPAGDGTLALVGPRGVRKDVAERWRAFPADAPVPLAEAYRTAQAVLCETVAEFEARYPTFADTDGKIGNRACAVLPLELDGRVLGALAFTFGEEREFTPADRAFLQAIARQCAQALERARLYEAEQRARGDAEAANRAKSEFLATMSHELRTPLNAIGGYTELIEMGIHGPVSDAQREALFRIQRNQRHLLGLINDVLNFARIEGGHLSLKVERVEVGEALSGLEPLVAPLLGARGLRYECRPCEGAGLAVRADRERLQQVLLNLLSNAVKFTEAGGVVSVEAARVDALVEVRVRDTGVGVPADKLEEIFEPFVQLDRGLTRTTEGTGLGLAISRDLARAMGGELSASANEGGGAVFTLALPAD